MKNMKIKARLWLSFAAVIALGLIIAVLGVIGMIRIETITNDMYFYQLVPVQAMGEMREAFQQERVYFRDMLIYIDDPAKVREAINNVHKSHEQGDAAVQIYVGAMRNPELEGAVMEAAGLLSPEEPLGAYYVAKNQIISSAEQGDRAGVLAGIEAAARYVETIETNLALSAQLHADMAKDYEDNSQRLFTFLILLQVIVLIVVLAASAFIAMLISGKIDKELRHISAELTDASRIINDSAKQLTEESEELAQGATEQASAIEETSSTMSESVSMIERTADDIKTASRISTEASDVLNESSKYMADMMGFVTELQESSGTISKIIKTIDEIAFQTNLLAINATVEAARAGGDAGRSFAVVAEEVRNLALKSSTAAANTTEIIEKEIALANSIKEGAERVGTESKKNAQQIGDLNTLLQEINRAGEEQATGIKQVTTAISQMEMVTQKNAAVAEEAASSAEELHNEVIVLDKLVTEVSELI